MKKKIYHDQGVEILLEPRKMKNLRLVYEDGQFILRYPRVLSLKEVKDQLHHWDKWIQQVIREHPAHNYDQGDVFLLFGRKVPFERKIAKKSFCQLTDTLLLHGPEDLSLEKRRKIVEDYFRELLRNRVEKTLPLLEKKRGYSFNKVEIKKMKNWGRCRPKERILSLSIKSIALEDELFLVLLFHELIHLEHPNHSRDFYNKMEEIWPGSTRLNRQISGHPSY